MSDFPPHMPPGLQQVAGTQNLVNIYNAVRAGFPPVCAQANYFPAYPPSLLTPPQAHLQPPPPLVDSHNSQAINAARAKALPSQSASRQLPPPPVPPLHSQTMKVASEISAKVDGLIASELAEASTSQSTAAEDQELMKAYPIYKKSEDIDQEEEETTNSKHSEEEEEEEDDDDDDDEEEVIGSMTRKRKKKLKKSKKPFRPPKFAKKEEEVTPRCKRCKKFMSTDNERNTFPMSTDGYCVYCNKAKTITEETRKEYINNSMCYLCGKTYGRPRNCMEHLRDVHREPAQVVFGRRSYENRLKACYYAKGTFLK